MVVALLRSEVTATVAIAIVVYYLPIKHNNNIRIIQITISMAIPMD